jgi:hypothetical protein
LRLLELDVLRELRQDDTQRVLDVAAYQDAPTIGRKLD